MRGKRGLLWLPALALLAAVLIAVNLPQKTAPVGAEEGMAAADFSVTCLDGGVFTLSEHRGRTVVINLWATWCAPCVKELAYFDRLQRERGDVTVLALHAPLVTEDVAAYAEQTGYELTFAVAPDDALIQALNGTDVLPQTVIISPDGTVTYNRRGSLTYETLLSLADAAGN